MDHGAAERPGRGGGHPDRQPARRGRPGHRRLDISDADLELLLSVDTGAWQDEADHTREYFSTFGSHLPEALWDEHEALLERLKTA